MNKKALLFAGTAFFVLVLALTLYKLFWYPLPFAPRTLLENNTTDITKIELYFSEVEEEGRAIVKNQNDINLICNYLANLKTYDYVSKPQDKEYGGVLGSPCIEIYYSNGTVEKLLSSNTKSAVLKELRKEGSPWVDTLLIAKVPEDFFTTMQKVYETNVVRGESAPSDLPQK